MTGGGLGDADPLLLSGGPSVMPPPYYDLGGGLGDADPYYDLGGSLGDAPPLL